MSSAAFAGASKDGTPAFAAVPTVGVIVTCVLVGVAVAVKVGVLVRV